MSGTLGLGTNKPGNKNMKINNKLNTENLLTKYNTIHGERNVFLIIKEFIETFPHSGN